METVLAPGRKARTATIVSPPDLISCGPSNPKGSAISPAVMRSMSFDDNVVVRGNGFTFRVGLREDFRPR